MRVLIIGYGYVGSAVASIFMDHEKVIIDPKINNNRIANLTDQKFDAAFVCVDTPKGNNTTVLEPVLTELNAYIGNDLPVCCKSTAIPEFYAQAEQTFSQIKIVHSPEYLSTKTNITDFQSQQFCILGGNPLAASKISDIFCQRIKTLSKNKVFITDIKTAALVKYSENFFLAMKVTFFNELYKIHQQLACPSSFNEFSNLVCQDPRIGHSSSQVPGPDGHFGWGGHCFNKDNYELEQFSQRPLITFINQLNQQHRQEKK